MAPRTQIGLFGGSFNPPHVCHALVTLWALQTSPIERVWWVPTYQHAFGKRLVSFEQRVQMCERAVAPLRGVSVQTIERELGGESRTIDTVRELSKRRPEADFWLIIGEDILAETEQWKQWDELVELVELLVVGRGDVDRGQQEGAAPRFALPDVSSTAIREALARGELDAPILERWVDREVLELVRAQGLYRRGEPQEAEAGA